MQRCIKLLMHVVRVCCTGAKAAHQSVPCLPGIKHFHRIKSIVLRGHLNLNGIATTPAQGASDGQLMYTCGCVGAVLRESGIRSPVSLRFRAGVEAKGLVFAPRLALHEQAVAG